MQVVYFQNLVPIATLYKMQPRAFDGYFHVSNNLPLVYIPETATGDRVIAASFKIKSARYVGTPV